MIYLFDNQLFDFIEPRMKRNNSSRPAPVAEEVKKTGGNASHVSDIRCMNASVLTRQRRSASLSVLVNTSANGMPFYPR